MHEVKYKTLYDAFFIKKNIFIDIAMMLTSVVFLSILANLSVPLWPVPITGQTFGIFVIAFFFGYRKGSLSILLYILAGLLGIGVFAQHKSGLAALLGPTGGYIFGFLTCVFVVGYMIEKGYGRSIKSVIWVMVIGNLIIYFFGLIGLKLYFVNAGKEMALIPLLMAGLIPFLIGDAIKIALAAGLFPYLWKGAEKIRGR